MPDDFGRMIELLEQIAEDNKFVADMYRKAEAECPEAVRRHTMYLHDLFDMRYMTEQLGLDFDPQLKTEMERSLRRLGDILEEEHHQGGAFHKSLGELKKHRDSHGHRLIHKGDPIV